VSKGAFYHHFPTKQAVFMALLNSYLNGIETGFNTMRLETEDVPQAIIQMAELVGSLFQTADIHLPIFLEFWTQANTTAVQGSHCPIVVSNPISPKWSR
jgi:AcrR family transcriptional regulator